MGCSSEEDGVNQLEEAFIQSEGHLSEECGASQLDQSFIQLNGFCSGSSEDGVPVKHKVFSVKCAQIGLNCFFKTWN